MNVTINVTANATLNGKNALITGSSQVLKAIALRPAHDGATVITPFDRYGDTPGARWQNRSPGAKLFRGRT